MWAISISSDPLKESESDKDTGSYLVTCKINLVDLMGKGEEILISAFRDGGHTARVSLADFVARHFVEHQDQAILKIDQYSISLEPLDRVFLKKRRRKAKASTRNSPYIVERTDFWCSLHELIISVRMIVSETSSESLVDDAMILDEEKQTDDRRLENAVKAILDKLMDFEESALKERLMRHIACTVLQHRIRSKLVDTKAVAFIADGSILPRKSGTSDSPMPSPPAVPFKAPADSRMSQTISVDMGSLARFLPIDLCAKGSSTVTMSGLVVPAGITLICGGGYHGKSTLLQTIALGIYDKISGDGREFCVAVTNAVTVRAEDGRYVNNCNISAFISNLPTPSGVEKSLDTQHFSSRDASGSTSQASNVVEAIEMGASALLIDEDVSAANFMARDGRMRALVMDESITPLLYRVNGLYNSHGISSVVVVGGVGDWLDVPHNVILLDKYVASDATKKAQSISYQFSYGHAQYAGRGVVHRLEWDKKGTPIPRRPIEAFSSRFPSGTVVSLLDGGHALSLHHDGLSQQAASDDDDEEDGCIEASRLQQLLGRKQLYACGLCVIWILQTSLKKNKLGMPDLLKELDLLIDKDGMNQVIKDISDSPAASKSWQYLLEAVGSVERPRKFEIGQALTRLYGIQMEEIPVEDDGSEAAALLEAERKKQALADLWAARRKK